MKHIITIFLIAVFLVSGCINNKDSGGGISIEISHTPESKCMQLCIEQQELETDFSNNLCLSELNKEKWNFKEHSCEIINSEQEDFDESTCIDYINSVTNDIVKLNQYCKAI